MTERRAAYRSRRARLAGAKYGNWKVDMEGYRFDSQAEAARYLQLRALERAGEIALLRVHPRYELIPALSYDGRRERAVFYVADFSYSEGHRQVVEDVKGYDKNPVWRLKRRLFLRDYAEYDLRLIKV